MHSKLDDKIPFIKEFVVPYLLWFVYVGYGIIYTGLHSKQEYYRLYFFLGLGMSAAYTLYMIFPNMQDLRPAIKQNDIFSRMVKFVYLTDTPTNVCPSIHVFNAIGVDAALAHSDSFCSKKYNRLISFIAMVLICLSTLFIKQHSVIDVFCGAILGIIFYFAIYLRLDIKQLKSKYKRYFYNSVGVVDK